MIISYVKCDENRKCCVSQGSSILYGILSWLSRYLEDQFCHTSASNCGVLANQAENGISGKSTSSLRRSLTEAASLSMRTQRLFDHQEAHKRSLSCALLSFDTELLGVLRIEPRPTELHRLASNDASDRSSAEKVIQNIETNVPPGSTH